MKRDFQRWWKRLGQRRAALRRASKNLRRPIAAPSYREITFGRARPGRFEVRLRWRRHVRAALALACAVAAVWWLWQSWIGLRIFNH